MNSTRNKFFEKKDGRLEAVSKSVLYISEQSVWGEIGLQTVSRAFPSVLPVLWSPGSPKPDLDHWTGDWIISFKSDLILTRDLLERAQKGAINFHPSPPKYRGLGGYWWALHNGDDLFGVTCHRMNEKIDHGEILKTNTFPIWPHETVESLKHKAAIHALTLLDDVLSSLVTEKSIIPNGEKWDAHLFTLKELQLAQGNYGLNAKPKSHEPVGGLPDTMEMFSSLASIKTIQQEILNLQMGDGVPQPEKQPSISNNLPLKQVG